MEGDHDAAERLRLGAALRALRLSGPNSTLEKAGAAFGTSAQGFRKYETGQAPTIFQPDVQRRLARAVGATREELLLRAASQEARAGLPVAVLSERRGWEAAGEGQPALPFRGRVRPGAWMADDALPRVSPPVHNLTRDPRFPHADQFVMEFEGDSMAAAGLFDGELIHCVGARDVNYWPLDGHLVLVERRRPAGDPGRREREISVRQVQVVRDGVLLWTRPGPGLEAEPVALPPGPIDADEADVRLVARVLASRRKFE